MTSPIGRKNYRGSTKDVACKKRYANSRKGKLRQADYNLRRYSFTTLDEKHKKFIEQKGLCAVCEKPLPRKWMSAHSDHNHKKKKARGILHNKCNILIGWLEKHFDKVFQGISYLKKYGDWKGTQGFVK